MRMCHCILSGTKACETCPNNITMETFPISQTTQNNDIFFRPTDITTKISRLEYEKLEEEIRELKYLLNEYKDIISKYEILLKKI